MPKKILEIINRKPLLWAILLGLFVRALSAFYNNTPVAIDDYANIYEPAFKKLQTGEPIVIGGIWMNYIPNVFYYFMYPLLNWFGIEDPGILLSWGLFCIGLISLTYIWGSYRLAGNFLNEKWQRHAVFFSSLYFFMPLFATRPLLSCLSLNTVVWAFYFLTRKNISAGDFFKGALFLGLSVTIRYQTGVFALFTTLYFFYLAIRGKVEKRNIGFFLAGALLSVFIMGFLDTVYGKYPLESLMEYLKYNIHHNIVEHNYGSAPWYTYILIILAVFIPPFSIVLFIPFLKVLRENIFLTGNLFFFVLFHSMIPNKMERFIIPVLPIFVLMTFQGFEKMDIYSRKIFKYSYRLFWVFNFILLFPVIMAKSQANTVDAAIYLRRAKQPVFIENIYLWKKAYMGYDKPSPIKVEGKSSYEKMKSLPSFYVLTLDEMADGLKNFIDTSGIQCSLEKTFPPSLLEKTVIYMNPKNNKRRDTTWLYNCKEP